MGLGDDNPRILRGQAKREKNYLRDLDQGDHTPYVLDPERRYAQDCDMVMRALAKIIAKKGYAVSGAKLAELRHWQKKGVLRYLDDLAEMGFVEQKPGGAWVLTPAGSAQIGYEHLDPILPSNIGARATSIRHARNIGRLVKDPVIQEAMKHFPKRLPTI